MLLLSVRLSVRPSHPWPIIREPKGLACPNLERRFPILDATRTPVKIKQSKVTDGRGHTVSAESGDQTACLYIVSGIKDR